MGMIASEELRLRVTRLINLIAMTNEAIVEYSRPDPMDALQVEQYRRLKSRFEKELLDLLVTELDIRIPVAA